MEKNTKIVPFFYKEPKRTQRSFRSFIKNGKERKNVAFFWKERIPNPGFSYIVCMYEVDQIVEIFACLSWLKGFCDNWNVKELLADLFWCSLSRVESRKQVNNWTNLLFINKILHFYYPPPPPPARLIKGTVLKDVCHVKCIFGNKPNWGFDILNWRNA